MNKTKGEKGESFGTETRSIDIRFNQPCQGWQNWPVLTTLSIKLRISNNRQLNANVMIVVVEIRDSQFSIEINNNKNNINIREKYLRILYAFNITKKTKYK